MERVYFEVPYNEKSEARELGGYWDANVKKWYAPTPEIRDQMETKWSVSSVSKKRKRELGKEPDHVSDFFNVPAQDSTFAEQKGAEWSLEKKCYFAPSLTTWQELAGFFDQIKDPEPATFIHLDECKEREFLPDEKWQSWMFDIPYEHKDLVKTKFDVRWDGLSKKWCASNMRTWDNLRLYFNPYVIDDSE